MNEKTTIDQIIRELVKEITTNFDEQGSSIKDIQKALRGASKTKTGSGNGKPEFIFNIGEFLLVIENKKELNKLEFKTEDENLDLEYPYRADYACNGAVHYAKHILSKSLNYKKIFAIGAAGNNERFIIKPYYLEKNRVVELQEVSNFENFKLENIQEYYDVAVNGELPREEKELRELNKIASDLHEDLRNYGQLEGEKKATVVSAILLALEERTFTPDSLLGLSGDNQKDGDILFNAVDTFLRNLEAMPYAKVGILKDQFLFLKNDVTLNKKNTNLSMTPLKYFTLLLKDKIMDKIKTTNWDILGNFYGEFVKYGGSDGNSLGIVLTPKHITELMAEIINVNKHDYVLDPAAGTGSFLISSMNRMLKQADNDDERSEIKKNRLFGVEIQQKLFTIATTNMILRGDGKSNLYRDDCFSVQQQMNEHNINKVLMNPPYSQANKENRHLSEINFIANALNMMVPGGKLAAIVPLSTMVGTNGYDKNKKKEILSNNTLEYVISLNKDTFYGVGVVTCICVFTSGIKHPENKRVKFINFEDDGYEVRKHVGLVGNGNEKNRKERLLDIINDVIDADTRLVVKSTIDYDDEWLHSYYYFDDEIPSDEDFNETIVEYLDFDSSLEIRGLKDKIIGDGNE
jgi:type I restriction-modification system DNA methylase subunit